MESLSSLNTAILLNRLLRKSTITRVVAGLRIALIVIMGIYAFLLVEEAISMIYSGVSMSSKLATDVQTRIAEAAPKEDEGKKVTIDFQQLAREPLFGAIGVKAEPTAVASKPVSNVALNLIGCFISTGEEPYSIIEDNKTKSQEEFKIGQMIFNEAKLIAIYSDRVEIDRGGKIEILKLDDTPDDTTETKDGVAEVGSDNFVVEEGEINKALENLPLLLTQARAVPYFKEGRSIGLRLFAIRSGSIFEKIGLKNGDILKSVNGTSMGDLSQAMKLFEKLKEERSVSVMLERDKVDREFKYQIK